MLRAQVGRALLLASVPAAAALGVLSYPHVLAVALGIGALTVLFDVAYQSFLPCILPRPRLIEGNSLLQIGAASARIGGPGIGGGLAQALGAPLALLGEAAVFLLAATSLSRTKARGHASLPPSGGRGAIREGLVYTLQEPALRTVTVVAASINLTLGGYEALVVVYLRRTVGLGPSTIGLLLASAGAAAVLASAVSGRMARRYGSARMVIAAVFLIAMFGPVTALAAPTPGGLLFFVLGACGLLMGVSWFNIIVRAFRQSYCDAAMLSRVTATMRFILLGAMPLGALAGGTLGQWLGPRSALAAILLSNLVPATVILVSPLRHLRDLPTSSGQER